MSILAFFHIMDIYGHVTPPCYPAVTTYQEKCAAQDELGLRGVLLYKKCSRTPRTLTLSSAYAAHHSWYVAALLNGERADYLPTFRPYFSNTYGEAAYKSRGYHVL